MCRVRRHAHVCTDMSKKTKARLRVTVPASGRGGEFTQPNLPLFDMSVSRCAVRMSTPCVSKPFLQLQLLLSRVARLLARSSPFLSG